MEFLVLDTFEKLRPKMKMIPNYAEAAEKINSMIDQPLVEPEVEHSGDDDKCDEESSKEEDHEEEENEDQSVIVHQNHVNVSEDHDFDKEFSKLVSESLDQRRVEKKITPFDTPIPYKMKSSCVESKESEVSFTLLTKRGNKPQVFSLANNIV